MELIKNTVRVGNSAGVLLPREYLNSQVKIVLEPLNIEKDVLEILLEEKILEKVMGAYIVGSYARGEQSIESDVDILVITNSLDKKIVKGKYELICVSKKELERQLKDNSLLILSMIKEAKPIINKSLLENYVSVSLTKKNLKWHIETTKSAMEFVKKDIGISKELGEKKTSDRIVYSLVLRLRTLYMIDCIRRNNDYKKKDFLKLIKKITGSLDAYEGYERSKGGKKDKSELSVEKAEKLRDSVQKKINEIEKWVSEKKG